MLKGLVTRNFTDDDRPQIRGIDDLSGDYVEEWIESDGSFGIFNDEELVGYLTLGYADDCGPVIENHPAHTIDSCMLSNVYVRKEFRGMGLGQRMIDEAINVVDETVYLSFIHDKLQSFYEKLGFELIEDYHMVKVKK